MVSVVRRAGSAALTPVPEPTAPVLEKFDGDCGRWACIAVATHKWAPPVGKFKWVPGTSFGHWTRPSDAAAIQSLHIMQLSWAVGPLSSVLASPGHPSKYRTEIVRPGSFTISSAAADATGISQELASANGRCLGDTLGEMISDLRFFMRAGGRICMHNLEREACVVEAELRRAGLLSDAVWWSHLAKEGLCLMDPYLAQWVRGDAGDALAARQAKFSELADRLLASPQRGQPAEQRWLALQRLHGRIQQATGATPEP